MMQPATSVFGVVDELVRSLLRPGSEPTAARVRCRLRGAKTLRQEIERADPIFVLGITPRSGSNYLWDLLLLHPDCAAARDPIHEDFFLKHADLLENYTKAVRQWWDPDWGEYADDLPDRLHEALGDGLISFLWTDRTRRLVTKTPSVANLDWFFTFFPRSRLLILIRDGRSVVQSSIDSFGWDFEKAARRWAAGAEEIARFHRANHSRKLPYRIVRYEDLVDDLAGALSPLLAFLDLDLKVYEFDAAAGLPVRGSSVFFGPGRDALHWEPVTKDPSFAPNERWLHWTLEQHDRFDWIAGRALRELGYEPRPPLDKGSRRAVRHVTRDGRWHLSTKRREIEYRLRVRLGPRTRPLRRRLRLLYDH